MKVAVWIDGRKHRGATIIDHKIRESKFNVGVLAVLEKR